MIAATVEVDGVDLFGHRRVRSHHRHWLKRRFVRQDRRELWSVQSVSATLAFGGEGRVKICSRFAR
ncbi:MAG TPA: hypothetical protein VGO30_11970 [Mycobacterium sp.]|nr:hypothetical protein [Mycobacterium sp.]